MPMFHAISYPRAFYPRDHNGFVHYVIGTPAIPTPVTFMGASVSIDRFG